MRFREVPLFLSHRSPAAPVIPTPRGGVFLLTLNRVGRGVEEPGRVGSALTSPLAPPLCGSAGGAYSSPGCTCVFGGDQQAHNEHPL